MSESLTEELSYSPSFSDSRTRTAPDTKSKSKFTYSHSSTPSLYSPTHELTQTFKATPTIRPGPPPPPVYDVPGSPTVANDGIAAGVGVAIGILLILLFLTGIHFYSRTRAPSMVVKSSYAEAASRAESEVRSRLTSEDAPAEAQGAGTGSGSGSGTAVVSIPNPGERPQGRSAGNEDQEMSTRASLITASRPTESIGGQSSSTQPNGDPADPNSNNPRRLYGPASPTPTRERLDDPRQPPPPPPSNDPPWWNRANRAPDITVAPGGVGSGGDGPEPSSGSTANLGRGSSNFAGDVAADTAARTPIRTYQRGAYTGVDEVELTPHPLDRPSQSPVASRTPPAVAPRPSTTSGRPDRDQDPFE